MPLFFLYGLRMFTFLSHCLSLDMRTFVLVFIQVVESCHYFLGL